MKKYAFFDFDNTIYGGYTYEDFINYASENVLRDNKYQLKLKSLPKESMSYNEIVNAIVDIVREIIMGWDKKTFVDVCSIACSRKKVLRWVYPVTEYLKSEGFENIIVTASFFEMISDSLEDIEIDRSFCSFFETKNGKYTGKIKLLMNDDKEVDAINHMISRADTFSIAFGDSVGDAPMLNVCDMAFLIRGYDAKVRKLAHKKGWNTVSDPNRIEKIINNKLVQYK